MTSLALSLANKKQAFYDPWVACLSGDKLAAIHNSWKLWGRDAQRPPAGDWRTWMIMAGRGFGKTRAGAEWINHLAMNGDGAMRIALVAATIEEAGAIMVEGESGVLEVALRGEQPVWIPSRRRLTWPTGATAQLYSGASPDGLRGPQHHIAWCDEIAKWAHAEESWNNLQLGLRLGDHPRALITTTPRPTPLLRALVAADGVAVTRGATRDNIALSPAYLQAMDTLYAGTRLGRQELEGELIAEAEGALWSRAMIEACRVRVVPEVRRVVIGVDPPAGSAGDACGIVVVALGADGAAYVLADASVTGASPEGWARGVADAAAEWHADRVIAEANNGGAMVESVLRAADAGLPVTRVHAAHGKSARAEPVSALYERGVAHHVGAFPDLEDELCGLIRGGGYDGPRRSPDRADALVWAMSDLMLGKARGEPRIRTI